MQAIILLISAEDEARNVTANNLTVLVTEGEVSG